MNRGSTLRFALGGAEEAFHAVLAEGRDPLVEGAFGRPGLRRPFGYRLAEQDERLDPLVLPLLLPGAQELDLLPLVGGIYATPLPPSHASPSRERCVGSEGCYGLGFAASSGDFRISARKAGQHILPGPAPGGRCEVIGEVS
jgi:hypothetical protein